MWKHYFRQTFKLFQHNKLLSIVSVIGTALSITMIMCIIIVMQIRTAAFSPENNRDRMLSLTTAIAQGIEDSGWNNGGYFSLKVIKECFYPLETAETVTAVIPHRNLLIASPGEGEETTGYTLYTDHNFWKVFDFSFIYGTPYNEAEFTSGIKKAVISQSIARTIFNTDNVVGRTISLSYVDYTICGVVKDVSVLAENAYADIWTPYTTFGEYEIDHADGLNGPYQCYILFPQGGSEEEVRQEVTRNVERLNTGQKRMKLLLYGAPDNRLMNLARHNMMEEPKVKELLIDYGMVMFILLLVPAINLSGLTFSRMKKRMEEMGVRRAFGARRGTLLSQVLTENLFLTLMGGIVGLILSYASVILLKDWLLNNWLSSSYGKETVLNTEMLIQPQSFLLALLFCLLLNVLSAGIPAYRVSRVEIIHALNS